MASLLGARFVGQPRLTGATRWTQPTFAPATSKNGRDDSPARTRREEGGLTMPTLMTGS
jgi:hypothetical protein